MRKFLDQLPFTLPKKYFFPPGPLFRLPFHIVCESSYWISVKLYLGWVTIDPFCLTLFLPLLCNGFLLQLCTCKKKSLCFKFRELLARWQSGQTKVTNDKSFFLLSLTFCLWYTSSYSLQSPSLFGYHRIDYCNKTHSL